MSHSYYNLLLQNKLANKKSAFHHHQFSPRPFFPTMQATPVARNTRAHDKHPKQKKKSPKRNTDPPNEIAAAAVADRALDRS